MLLAGGGERDEAGDLAGMRVGLATSATVQYQSLFWAEDSESKKRICPNCVPLVGHAPVDLDPCFACECVECACECLHVSAP